MALYPWIAATVLDEYRNGERRSGEDAYEPLTSREKQVLELIAEGRTSRAMGELLCISIKTAMGHRTNLMEKLGVRNQAERVKFAEALGLVWAG
ncbi:MAG: LuxR C-terminal-related transcriptional regulator [Planctomycetota bacterium]|nr:LuxR C-terminal-related transcriptional regulator [Planctomycetota bacterium]